MKALIFAPRRDEEWSRAFWGMVNRRLKSVSPALCFGNGKPMGRRSQAALFVELFSSKHARCLSAQAQAHRVKCEELLRTSPALPWSPLPVSRAEVGCALRQLRTNQSADPIGLKPVLFHQMSDASLERVADLFTSLLAESYMPPEWCSSQVIPLWKGEAKPRSEPGSYRPVSITHALCRLMERVVLARILHAVEVLERPLHPHQFGFRPGMSSELCLAHILSSLTDYHYFMGYAAPPNTGTCARGTRYETVCVAVDFTDAFCRVPPEAVECVLREREVPADLTAWAMAFYATDGCRCSWRSCLVGAFV
ncbi:hypothetical protein STCU_12308 [Strigomonas culicis]|uniref:Reverse transcriptase domain-containing protein n=1 Tax=Strigomonas culicis TaxID=28005 RepID=S9TDY8_9TRYP|nr:hypothetical protein STCU_12308 [Strigomonas culicis]|eukprot:EPY15154.1 hypothetical protein STCU_12308 [Strigomonas culicis]